MQGASKGNLASASSGSLMVKEDQEEGQVTGRVYGQYIAAYGMWAFYLLIVLWSSEQVRLRCVGGWPACRLHVDPQAFTNTPQMPRRPCRPCAS